MNVREIVGYSGISAAAFAVLAGCGGGGAATPASVNSAASSQSVHRSGGTQAIRNVIVVIQEERSFDNLFAGYAGADAPTKGLTSSGRYVPLRRIRLEDVPHCVGPNDGGYFKTAYDRGRMDGWNLLDKRHPLCPYTRVERSEVAPYWKLAKQYAIADRMFSSTRFNQFVEN